MEVQTELITEFREKFFKKLVDEGPPDPKFHPVDIAKIKDNNHWLQRFLEHNENNVQEALNMLWETCCWRSKFGTNEITEENVMKEYLNSELCFIHGKDRDGKTMFIIRCKLHTKGSKDFSQLQKLVVYWFERLERQTNGNQISLFFDMSDTGILNMDMEFIKYLINLCKNYYPNFLNYIIIFEMPWILNTGFKIIKSWLPPKAIPKIKFVQKNNIHEFVEPNDILTCWGGSNEYVFKFVSEAQNNDATMNGKFDNKKVHFTEASPLTEQSPSNFGEQAIEEQLLSVEPDALIFNKTGNEISGTITLKNVISTGHNTNILYSEKPAEEHKLRCCDGGITSSESSKLHSTSGISESGQIDILSRKITHLKDSHTKLYNDVAFLKYLSFFSMTVTIIMAILVIYILKIDIKNTMDQQACHIHHGI
ncbi:Motile sperm domain-containing protein 2 [Melipona quadrifasciata]|uniref:Motile sperm domain-containing protein 2 n=1 Tax=Melipona quadrifasciata TaxID=166423 RepID=A0A0N0BIJ7_9HYME|nr:Motile sperm domain-containing protein 2 [Melipona quadrifasciata]